MFDFNGYKALSLEAEIKALKEKIRNHVGFVPSEWYDELNDLEVLQMASQLDD